MEHFANLSLLRSPLLRPVAYTTRYIIAIGGKFDLLRRYKFGSVFFKNGGSRFLISDRGRWSRAPLGYLQCCDWRSLCFQHLEASAHSVPDVKSTVCGGKSNPSFGMRPRRSYDKHAGGSNNTPHLCFRIFYCTVSLHYCCWFQIHRYSNRYVMGLFSNMYMWELLQNPSVLLLLPLFHVIRLYDPVLFYKVWYSLPHISIRISDSRLVETTVVNIPLDR